MAGGPERLHDNRYGERSTVRCPIAMGMIEVLAHLRSPGRNFKRPNGRV